MLRRSIERFFSPSSRTPYSPSQQIPSPHAWQHPPAKSDPTIRRTPCSRYGFEQGEQAWHEVKTSVDKDDHRDVPGSVLAWVTLLGYSSTLGFHVSLLRFVPAYQAKQEWALVRGVIQYSERGAAGTAVSIVLIGVCGIIALHGSMRPELAHTFLLGIAAVPFLTLHLIGASVVRAFGGVVAALAPERVVRDSLLLAIIAVAFWGNLYRLDATLAMGATFVSSLVMLGLVRIFLRRMRPPSLDHAKPAYAAGDWWRP